MIHFVFTKNSQKEFKKLDEVLQARVIKKLQYLKQVSDPLHYMKALISFKNATHRIRVWDIRIILYKSDISEYIIVDIWKRGDIYKGGKE